MALDVAGESPAASLEIDQEHGVAPLCRRVVWHAETGPSALETWLEIEEIRKR